MADDTKELVVRIKRNPAGAVYADCLGIASDIYRAFQLKKGRPPTEQELAMAATIFIQRAKQRNIEEVRRDRGK